MKVETIKENEVTIVNVPVGNCFKFGFSIYMRVRNPGCHEGGKVSVVNLLNGEIGKLDIRTEVVPINLEAVERPNAKS